MATSKVPVQSPADTASHQSINATSNSSSSESEKSSSSQPRYASYKQYLDENATDWPQLKWMQSFMNTPSGEPDDTRVTFIDSIDGAFHRQSIPTTDPNSLSTVLESRGSGVKTRIIIVDYKESFSIDRAVVDTLGTTFNIDPLVFQVHFFHEALEFEHSYPYHLDKSFSDGRIAHLASQYRSAIGLNIHISFHGFTSACVMLQGGNLDTIAKTASTIIIWTRLFHCDEASFGINGSYPRFTTNPKQRPEKMSRMDTRYEAIISKWRYAQIALADADLTQYAAPLISVFLQNHVDRTRKEWDSRLGEYSAYTDDIIYDICERTESLKRMRRAVNDMRLESPWRSDHKPVRTEATTSATSPLALVSRDLDHCLDGLQLALAHQDRIERDELSSAQLGEARKPTYTATSVARLTKLAFIFIPLNFVTSFFGMNMTQFGAGGLSLWTFFVTATGMVCIMLTPFVFSVASRNVTFARVPELRTSPASDTDAPALISLPLLQATFIQSFPSCA